MWAVGIERGESGEGSGGEATVPSELPYPRVLFA
jgi:hypothetical protein